MKVDVWRHEDGQICEKCGEPIVLGEYCSYDCLKEKADKLGVPVDQLLAEMERIAKTLFEKLG